LTPKIKLCIEDSQETMVNTSSVIQVLKQPVEFIKYLHGRGIIKHTGTTGSVYTVKWIYKKIIPRSITINLSFKIENDNVFILGSSKIFSFILKITLEEKPEKTILKYYGECLDKLEPCRKFVLELINALKSYML